MTATQTFRIGQMVWDRGQNVYGDAKTGGMVTAVGANADGETEVTVITNARPDSHDKRPSLIVHHHDGRSGRNRPAYDPQGAVARLVRIPATDIDPAMADGFVDPAKMILHARMALAAAWVAMLPDYADEYARTRFVAVFHDLLDEARRLLMDGAG